MPVRLRIAAASLLLAALVLAPQPPTHAFGPEGGMYTDFWWEAQLWEFVMDAYQRTGSATYRQMIDDVYTGFVAYYPTFSSDFNDDIARWALASIRAYEITGTTTYLTTAQNLFT